MSIAQREERERRDKKSRRRPGDDPFQRERVREETGSVLERWQSPVALSTVRRRLQSVISAGLVMILFYYLLDPGGIAGLLITLWFLLSVPVVAIAACILILLKDPANAPEVWWDNGLMATVGLISLAGFSRVGRATPFGRTIWEFMFGSDHPSDDNYKFGTRNSEIDFSAVARIRRYLWYGAVISVGVILAEQAIRYDVLGAGVFDGLLGIDPSPVAWIGLSLVLVVVGLILGALVAASDI